MTLTTKLGFSVYLSSFHSQKLFLETVTDKNRLIFTSLHIPEEMDDDFVTKATEMLDWLQQRDFKVICDISPRTLTSFSVDSIEALANKLNIYMVRIDYGFEFADVLKASTVCPIVFNASTLDLSLTNQIQNMFGLHNFYPREYTGISYQQFIDINMVLNQHQINVLTFIPNAKQSRGPIFEGLPTIESQRYQNPYVSFIEFSMNPSVQGIILSDLGLSKHDLEYITTYETDQIISIPAELDNKALYDQVFTIRLDSPETSLRLVESRMYASQGPLIEPCSTLLRKKGTITCDNKHYLRYSGELQIIKSELPKDHRVNVIGKIHDDYLNLCTSIKNGSKIVFKKL